MITPMITTFVLLFPAMLLGETSYEYRNTKDEIDGKIQFDNKLHSEFFDSHETSYPWYIFKIDDRTFETVLDREITNKDKTPIEHTSNCVSTHQGKHIMNFCDAAYDSGVLQLEIFGGMPAYSSALMIRVKDSEFWCYFKAAYPAPVYDCKWNILSKRLTFKSSNFKKGKRIYAFISVEFEETSSYHGKTTTNKYKIEGYLKPIVK
jgi:hypothetical protein